ncbi:unnamed protein product, partial [Adineta steineri]
RDMTEAEMRGFFDDLLSTLLAVVQKPLEDALSTTALLGAQVLAGAGVNGVSLDSLFGKRDLTEAEMRGFWEDFANSLLAVVQKPVEQALSTAALLGAQMLAGAGVNGVSLDSLFGKRSAEARGPVIDGLLSHATG